MRTGLAYTSARILFLVVAMVLLYLAGARGLLLLALAVIVSALASYVLLSKQRDVMAAGLARRMTKTRQRAAEFRARIDEGARAEDEDEDDHEDDEDGEKPAVGGHRDASRSR